MMTLTEDDKAVLLLTTRVAGRGVASLPPTDWHRLGWALRDAGKSPSDLFTEEPPEVVADLSARVADLIGRGAGLAFELEDLERRGIVPVTVMSEQFPSGLRDRLGPLCPPVIFAAGDLGALKAGGLGVVGSRDVTKAGADVATEAAIRAAELGIQVVSGAARGVDRLAMTAATRAGGWVLGVVADSLQRRLQEPEVRELVADGMLTLVTIQHPNAPFSAGSAMGRNKIIYALSDAVLVVASDVDKGGTWAGAREALAKRISPVLVWRGDGEGPGNTRLASLGATEVTSVEGLFATWPPQLTSETEQLTIL
jgi:predicted Rossmann fold nucleotide-binding protein DprA/Smf involved in DNA uptake